jgi:serine-type D-Ala-D-Ala carboxypeptidase/endopeptidase (penicillin-binding protein 4)
MSRHPRVGTLLLLAATLAPVASRADESLAGKVDALVNAPEYKHSHWGALVADAATGKELYALNADKLFLPASTTKLYSCAAALAALGPDHRFYTRVHARGPIKDGVLRGDLVLVASGDLTFGGRTLPDGTVAFKDSDHTYANGNDDAELTDTNPLAGLEDLARQVKAAGVTRVEGEVLIDDRLFDRARGSGSGPGLVTPILVNDNVIDVTITPAAKPGEPATVTVRPETGYVRWDAVVETVDAKRKPSVEVRQAGLEGFAVRGRVPAGGKPLVRVYNIADPSAFARALFIEALRREQVRVTASPYDTPRAELPERGRYGETKLVAEFKSPPFAEVIKVTLKVSHNLYASTLPLLLAAQKGKRTLEDGLRLQRQFLADAGVDVDTISFGGGAGGANADHVTPRATVQLLRALAGRPEYPAFHKALPVLGVDGTLAKALDPESPARGKAQAKTGTLTWQDVLNDRSVLTSKALAGTLTTASGRPLMFAFYVNKTPLPKGGQSSREGKALGRLCEIVYRYGP